MADYNPAGLHSTADALSAYGQRLQSATPTDQVAPAGADPISVAAASSVNANSTAMSSTMAMAAHHIITGAAALHAAADVLAGTEQGNAASLSGQTAAALTPPPPAIPVDPAPPTPQVAPRVVSAADIAVDPEGDPEPTAIALRSGDGGASLNTHATQWHTASTTLSEGGSLLQSLSARTAGDWSSPDGQRAATALTQMGGWLSTASGHASTLADTSTQHAASFTRAVATHPTPEQVIAAKNQVKVTAAEATTNAGAIPAYHVAVANYLDQVRQGVGAATDYRTQTASYQQDAPTSSAPPTIANGSGANQDQNTNGDKKNKGKPGEPDPSDPSGAPASPDAGTGGDQALTGGDVSDTTSGDPSIANDGQALGQQMYAQYQDQQTDQQIATTGMQIGMQVLQQGMQAAQSLSSAAATSLTSPLTNPALNGDPGLDTSGDLTGGSPDLGAGGGGGGDLSGGSPDVGAGGGGGVDVGGDSLGTEPSGLITPVGQPQPSTAISTPTAPPSGPPSTTAPAASTPMMPMSPMMSGMAGLARGTQARERNHQVYPDQVVYRDDTERTEETIGERPPVPPPITP